MKVLLLCDRGKEHQNYIHLIDSIASGLLRNNVAVSLLIGAEYDGRFQDEVDVIETHHFTLYAKSYDERRYLELFLVAATVQPDLIILIDTPDPQRLYLAMETYEDSKRFRYAIYPSLGWGQFLFKPINGHFFDKLLAMDCFVLAFIASNNPSLDAIFYRKTTPNPSDKVHFIHDITHIDIVGGTQKYLELDRLEIRRELGIAAEKKVFFYFGTYFYLKGADILLDAALKMADNDEVLFVFAGDMRQTSYDLQMEKYESQNILIFNQYLENDEVCKFFAMADVVVLPYRQQYTRFCSAVFAQACVAQTPVLVPSISPMQETVQQYQLGAVFDCESLSDLEHQLRKMGASSLAGPWGHQDYVESFTSVQSLAKLLMKYVSP